MMRVGNGDETRGQLATRGSDLFSIRSTQPVCTLLRISIYLQIAVNENWEEKKYKKLLIKLIMQKKLIGTCIKNSKCIKVVKC